MTKNPHDHREWTNEDIQEDAEGYLAAQQTYREEAEALEAKWREEDDRARFTEQFVAAGGNRADAAAEWRRMRNERATEVGRHDEEASLHMTRRHISGRL
jgi:hypothetical protein